MAARKKKTTSKKKAKRTTTKAGDDFIERTVALRDSVAGHAVRPTGSKYDHALRDAWDAIMDGGSKARRMIRRLDEVAKAENWEFDEQDRAFRLRPAKHALAKRRLGPLYTDLATTLTRYQRVRPRWRAFVTFGIFGPMKNAPIGTKKAIAEAKKAAAKELAKIEKKRGEQVKAARALMEGVIKALEARQDLLQEQILQLQVLVHDIQRTEEERLQSKAARLAAGSRDKGRAGTLLSKLREGRIDLRHFRHQEPVKYHQRWTARWARPRLQLLRVLDGIPEEPV